MSGPTMENQVQAPAVDVVEPPATEEQALTPEEVTAYEELALKRMMVLVAEMKDWLQENFGFGAGAPEQVAEKIKAMTPLNIQSRIFDYNNEIVIIDRMVDLHTIDSKNQRSLIEKWQTLSVDQVTLDMISLPDGVSAEEFKSRVHQFASDIQSKTGVEAIGHVFVERYKKENGVVVEKNMMDRMRRLFSQDNFDVQDVHAIRDTDLKTKADTSQLYDEEVVPTLVQLYELLEQHGLDNLEDKKE